MKKFWKALGIAALAAAVPVRIKKDEETGKKSYQSLLWKMEIGADPEGGTEIGLSLMDGVLTAPLAQRVTAKRETVHFADDDPEAAVVADVIDFTEAAKAHGEDVEEFIEPDEVPAAEPEAAEPVITEEDFDPEL